MRDDLITCAVVYMSGLELRPSERFIRHGLRQYPMTHRAITCSPRGSGTVVGKVSNTRAKNASHYSPARLKPTTSHHPGPHPHGPKSKKLSSKVCWLPRKLQHPPPDNPLAQAAMIRESGAFAPSPPRISLTSPQAFVQSIQHPRDHDERHRTITVRCLRRFARWV